MQHAIERLILVFQMSELTDVLSKRNIMFALYSVDELDKMSVDIKDSYSSLHGFSLRNEEMIRFLVLCRERCVTMVMKEVLECPHVQSLLAR